MRKFQVAIVGGGASGMLCALLLADAGITDVAIFERNDRLGRKLSVTGNGQGNISNMQMSADFYFSDNKSRVKKVLDFFGKEQLLGYLEKLGGLFFADKEGRIYPASRQASSVTDILRFAIEKRGLAVFLNSYVRNICKDKMLFQIDCGKDIFCADYLVLCSGGCAAPYLGTDGNGYAIARSFGHTISEVSPSLVQLKTEQLPIRGLKGVRTECLLRLLRKGNEFFNIYGDIIFTDYGISGNAVFRASSYVQHGDIVSIDFLPSFKEEALSKMLKSKIEMYAEHPSEDLLRCVINSAIGKSVLRYCGIGLNDLVKNIRSELPTIVKALKNFRLKITGTMGFENAQVTKGGVLLSELNDTLMSSIEDNLFFAGELVNVDGVCGGYNLQWAFSSGAIVADGITRRIKNANR